MAIPNATYRLQLNKGFTFDDAAAIVPYLRDLGISHVYASPFLKARSGSMHGYDIVDHNAFNPELGGEAGFLRMSDALRAAGLGLILDFVPNHMGVGLADNAWWLDVLEWGPKSPHARSFDIAWDALPHRRQPGVLLPILGKPYGDALRDGELTLNYDAETGSFAVWYFDHKLPVSPPGYSEILRQVVSTAGAEATQAGRALRALADSQNGPHAPHRYDAPSFKERLAAIPDREGIITRGLAAYAADTPHGLAALHRLLERQHYRLAFWRVAFSAINYRRFFDVNDLAGLRMEDPATFRASHALIARLIAEDRLQGLRLDHIDGLRDPMQYTRRLRQLARQLGKPDLYVIVEKILEGDEALPRFPGVAGTTGYEWLNAIMHMMLNGDGLPPLTALWREISGHDRPFPDVVDEAKGVVLTTMLASEFTVLTDALARIAAGHYSTRDYTQDRLRAALDLYVREFPVYRTYVIGTGPSPHDRATIEETIGRARRRWRGPDPDIFEFLRGAITLDLAKDASYSAPRVRAFAFKLQQFTGPLMAKALEDTAFYRDQRLIALNEVGGAPDAKPLGVDAFHTLMQRRQKTTPHGLTATATHDTKRGEDTRMRILMLAELAPAWAEAVARWRDINAHAVTVRDGRRMPSAVHEYMLYQTLLGTWPLASAPDERYRDRIAAYAQKAAREGKQETSWTNPDADYEQNLDAFVHGILSPDNAGFIHSMSTFASDAARLGAAASLSQLVLKATLPGVPDFYQGTELWDFSLVDPDNRRPIDFAKRRALLDNNCSTAAWNSELFKFHVTRRLLALRKKFPNTFRIGTYLPVPLAPDGIIAFTRMYRDHQVLVITGRRFSNDQDVTREATMQRGTKVPWHDVLRDRVLPRKQTLTYAEIMRDDPVAVLSSAPLFA
jgi:(1->4)-alpha-D-glucan 1-alpha-D-glucosylmutase